MYRHLLVPLDDSELASDLISEALALAKPLGARVTFMSARPDYAATSDGALQYAMQPEVFKDQAEGHALGVLAKAEVAARVAEVPSDTVVMTSDRPFEAIIDTANAHGCDLIFMASHGRRGLRRLILGSQTEKVLQHSRIPVLVSSVASNVEGNHMARAVALIRDEHRSLAAVLQGMRRILSSAVQCGTIPELTVLRAALVYIRRFPATLHHPKEESWLFARMRGRSADVDAVLDELESQHRDGVEHLGALERVFDEMAVGRIPPAQFLEALDAFAEGEWAHMSIEEKIVLPEAQKVLDEETWRAIAAAFVENGDPRFNASTEQEFRELYSRIVNLSHRAT